MTPERTANRNSASGRLAELSLVSMLLLSACASDPDAKLVQPSGPVAAVSARSATAPANDDGSLPSSDGSAAQENGSKTPGATQRDADAVECHFGITSSLAFRKGSAALEPCTIVLLDDDVASLKRYPDMRAEVSGHTDVSDGTGDHMQLSRERARAVRDYLIDHGIDVSRLDGPVGYGESRRVAPSDLRDGTPYPEGAARNRRAEVSPRL